MSDYDDNLRFARKMRERRGDVRGGASRAVAPSHPRILGAAHAVAQLRRLILDSGNATRTEQALRTFDATTIRGLGRFATAGAVGRCACGSPIVAYSTRYCEEHAIAIQCAARECQHVMTELEAELHGPYCLDHRGI